jgi:tRNA(Ile2)-agmatinylcytidine synthase
MVWFDQQPDAEIYWAAVRGNVNIEELPQATRSWGGHGRIGATASVAWPAENVTWEAIAWRIEDETGQRKIDENMLSEIDKWEDIVFSRDPRRGTGLIAPRGQSPVLFGIRSITKRSAEVACQTLLASDETEQHDGWRVFCTNQASGDHLQGHHRGRVTATTLNTARKHVVITTETFSMVSYSEGGPVNALARWLNVGDEIDARGLVHPDGSLHVEQLRILDAVPRKQRRPMCQTCGVRMKSMGSNQGLRCPSCKHRIEDAWEDVSTSPPFVGWTEPPVGARRHLARPLSWPQNNPE